MNSKKSLLCLLASCRLGFTLVELLVVVLIIAMLATITVMGVSSLVAAAEFNYAGSDVVALMRQARVTAASSHKPVRVAINCRLAEDNPDVGCNLHLGIAQLDVIDNKMTFAKWHKLGQFSQELPPHVKVWAKASSSSPSGHPITHVYFTAVFFPSGKASVFPDDAWQISSNRFSGEKKLIRVNPFTGLVRITTEDDTAGE